MKLRNKLVAVMAASMVVTSVPVVTMAESTNALSVYNYTIKDSTIGFNTTDAVLVNSTTEASIKAAYTHGEGKNGTAEFKYDAYTLPKLEITPESNYNTTEQKQSAFLYLTEDSEFKKEAYLAFVDALNNNGSSKLYLDKDGYVKGANSVDSNGKSWNGQKADDLIRNGELKVGYTVGGDSNFATFTKADSNNYIVIKPTEISGTKFNDREYKSVIRIDFNGEFKKGVTYQVPFLAKVGGDKEVLAYLDGNDSFVSSKTFAVTGVLSDKKLTATADCKTITVDNIEEIGEIRLDENQIGALDGCDNKWIKIKLPSSADLEFNISKTRANAKASIQKGVGKEYTHKQDGDFEVRLGEETRARYSTAEEDNQVLLVKLPNIKDSSAKGRIVLTGIYVQPKDKTAATGDVKVTVSEDLTRGNTKDNKQKFASEDLIASTELKVATVADYGVTIETTPIDVKAGRSGIVADKRVTFTLKEAVKDSLVDSRKIEFNLENGYIFGPADVEYGTKVEDLNKLTYTYNTDSYTRAAKETFEKLVDDEVIKFEEKAEIKKNADGTLKEGFDISSLALNIDANGYVTGFSARYEGLKDTEDDKIKVTMPVAAPVQAKGEIKVKAGNLFTRTYEKDVEAVVANIIEPITVEIENAALKVGLQDQKAGKITIKETDKGMFERGWLYLSAEDFENLGITFDVVPQIKVASGNMEIKNIQISRDNKVVAFEVSKTSTEASTIEISDIKFTADRTVPEANYDLQIWGDALTDENVLDVANYSLNAGRISSARAQFTDMFVVPEFITMTTKNTQDIDASGLKAATATFVINESKFTVNGESVAMDSAAYIKNNYTMVPVKYVAKAFGIEGNAVQYDQATHTATIVAGNKVIAITAGKAFITVNGTQVPMATKAEVKDGRMCVPMAYIATALDVQKSWDATTKTATFTNQTENK